VTAAGKPDPPEELLELEPELLEELFAAGAQTLSSAVPASAAFSSSSQLLASRQLACSSVTVLAQNCVQAVVGPPHAVALAPQRDWQASAVIAGELEPLEDVLDEDVLEAAGSSSEQAPPAKASARTTRAESAKRACIPLTYHRGKNSRL